MGRGVRFESGWGDEMEEVRLSMGRVCLTETSGTYLDPGW